jgi:hypothetical protein
MHLRSLLLAVLPVGIVLVPSSTPQADGQQNEHWTVLSTPDFAAWQGKPADFWVNAESVTLDPKNPRKLVPTPGQGIYVNNPAGKAKDLLSKAKFGDIELHVEFLISKGSNSGVKFHGHYEIQINDSAGKKMLTGDDCGGIYPRAELKPKYQHIDKGIAPKVNAALPAGQWQTLEAVFLAPRFDAEGKKIASARLVRALLNGQVIHDNVELKTPTGHLWKSKEMTEGPLLLQGDHGPVAFRNVKVRPYVAK